MQPLAEYTGCQYFPPKKCKCVLCGNRLLCSQFFFIDPPLEVSKCCCVVPYLILVTRWSKPVCLPLLCFIFSPGPFRNIFVVCSKEVDASSDVSLSALGSCRGAFSALPGETPPLCEAVAAGLQFRRVSTDYTSSRVFLTPASLCPGIFFHTYTPTVTFYIKFWASWLWRHFPSFGSHFLYSFKILKVSLFCVWYYRFLFLYIWLFQQEFDINGSQLAKGYRPLNY